MTPHVPPHRRPQAAAELRSRAGRAIRAQGPPTRPIGVRGDENGPADQHAREVIDLILRIGEALLATGSSASDVTSTVLRLARVYDVRSAHVDVTFTSILVAYHRGPYRDPITVMRIVPTTAADFLRLEQLQTLVREIIESAESGDPMTVGQARSALERAVNRPHLYRRWVVTLAMALLGAGVTGLLGGGPAQVVLTALVAAGIDRTQRRLALLALPAFFSQAICAAIPTTVGLVLWAISAWTDSPPILGLTPSAVVATGVVVLLVGLAVVSTAQDTLDGYYVTAAGRAFEVGVLSAGVVAGVLITLAIGQQLGVPLQISTAVGLSDNLALSTVAAFVCAGANAVAAYTSTRGVLASAVIGAAAWMIFRLAAAADLDPIAATAVAATMVGATSQLVSTILRVPSLAIATGGIVPLVPGLAVFQGIYGMVQGGAQPTGDEFASLVTAAAMGMAIAGGVSLGSLPIRHRRADRVQRRLLRRSAGDSRE